MTEQCYAGRIAQPCRLSAMFGFTSGCTNPYNTGGLGLKRLEYQPCKVAVETHLDKCTYTLFAALSML